MLKSIKSMVSLFVVICIAALTVVCTGVSAANAVPSTKVTKVDYNAKKKSVKITWKKVAKAKGYQVQVSTAKKFKKSATKTYAIKKAKTVTKTVTKLKVGKTYYVRVRVYKTAKVKGKKKTVYSKYSPVKKFKATKYVAPQPATKYPPAQGLNDKTVGVSSFVSDFTGYKYTLKFIDEFEGTTLNNKNWRLANGSNANGSESQQNVDRNVVVENGKLRLFAKKETTVHQTSGGRATYYTGCKIDSSNLINYKYGRIEMLARLPDCQYGAWPAFWSIGYGQWPMVGEIDIMEMIASNVMYASTLHFAEEGIEEAWLHDQPEGFGGGFIDPSDRFCDGYHVIGIEWTPDKIISYCNGEKGGEADITRGDKITAFRNYEHYMILNYALGGMGGSMFGPDGWSDSMDVEWVKVWQTNDFAGSIFYTGIQKDVLESMGK